MTRKRLGRYIVPLLGVPCIVIGQWSSTRCFAQQPQIYRLPPVEDDRWTSIESLIPYDQSESAVNTKKQSVAQPGSFQLQGPQSPQPAITVNPRDRGATYPQSAPESVAAWNEVRADLAAHETLRDIALPIPGLVLGEQLVFWEVLVLKAYHLHLAYNGVA